MSQLNGCLIHALLFPQILPHSSLIYLTAVVYPFLDIPRGAVLIPAL